MLLNWMFDEGNKAKFQMWTSWLKIEMLGDVRVTDLRDGRQLEQEEANFL